MSGHNEEVILDALSMTVVKDSSPAFSFPSDVRKYNRTLAYNRGVILKFLENVDDSLTALELREALAGDEEEGYVD